MLRWHPVKVRLNKSQSAEVKLYTIYNMTQNITSLGWEWWCREQANLSLILFLICTAVQIIVKCAHSDCLSHMIYELLYESSRN